MIHYELLDEQGILVVTPTGPLEKSDFDRLKEVADEFINTHGQLAGLMICTETFPGWSDFAALINHLKFVKDHHRQIAKVAAVTDSGFLSILPKIADHFVKAEVRHFDFADREKALSWLNAAGESL